MAATPEEFLGQQGAFLAVPEPFSPSVFLDLPPTPRPDGGATSDDDLVLPFISRMLMEEDIDDNFFYQYPDHPALLTAQQPYAQILSAPSSSSDSAATNTAPSPSAEPAWPYDPTELAQLLRSPPCPDPDAVGVGLHDFAAALSPALPSSDGAIQSSSSGSRGGAADEEGTTLVAAAGEDHDALTSAFFSVGHQGVINMDMLNRAFAKGMEEARKFLPANSGLLIDLEATNSEHSMPTDDASPFTACQVKKEEEEVDGTPMLRGRSSSGRGRKNRHHEEDLEIGRNSKVMMMMPPEQEDADAQEMYRELMTFNVDEFMKRMRDLRIAMDSESEKSSRKGATNDEAVDLRTMLVHCAQAVATGGDPRSAHETLRQIKRHASLTGDATQRLARCFAEGLEARLAGTGSLVYRSLVSKRTSVADYLRAHKLFMAASCFKKAKHVFSNRTIVDAVAGKKSRLHIVDYGVQHGFQWPSLLHCLVSHPIFHKEHRAYTHMYARIS